jgi:membrane associated rhomboid family serine protease
MGFGDRDYYRPQGFGGFSVFPPVIKYLLIINGTVFFIDVLLRNVMFDGVSGANYLHWWFSLNPTGAEANFQLWQLITYQFLHADFWHIGFNMFALWMFGMEIENYWGSSKFLLFYLSCGIIGGILHLIFTPEFTIGASGSVFGVLVAFAMFFPDRYIFLYFLFPIKAKYLVVGIMLLEFLSIGSADITAHTVHVGGGLSGLAFVLLDRKYNFNVEGWVRKVKRMEIFDTRKQSEIKGPFRKPFKTDDRQVKDAKFYDIDEGANGQDEVSQDEIDRILDKISRSGYQNLTEEEKRKLFEASKKN